MSILDSVMLVSIGLVLAWPYLFSFLAGLWKPGTASIVPSAPADGRPIEQWRQSWASRLITLIEQIENQEDHFVNDKAALALAKELLWEIIGGDGLPSKGK